MKFIDASIQLGRRCLPREGAPNTTDEILEVMERCHIEKAIAYHAIAKEGGMADGNAEILKITGGNTPFLPQWCAMPSTFGEFMTPDVLFAKMKEHGVKTLRLLPKTCGYSLRPYALGKLMEAAADCHVPVFMDLETEVEPADMYTICQDYPEVNFVFCRPSYGQNRILAGVFDTCPNCYLGAGNYLVHGGIQLHCRYYGAQRLVFDTGLPDSSATSAVSLICYADISQEEKELIASGNIQRLLDGVTL